VTGGATAGVSPTLAPIDEERISEAAGVNSASGSFGLSFGLAVAGGVLLATLSLAFTNMTNASPVIPSAQQQQIAQTLEDDAQIVSNTQLDELLADHPRPSGKRSSTSTPTRRTSPFTWRCSCPSSRVSSGCSTRSA
jgi:hypothetical protein